MEKLHELIHKLSKGEKRYVKVKLKANKSSSLLNSYFDCLSKQKKYSFDEVKNVRNQSVSLTKSSLTLLYDVILKNLVNLNGTKKEEQVLRNEFTTVTILKEKGLYTSAISTCKKLIKKAELKEEYGLLKEVYDEFWNLHLFTGELNDDTNKSIQTALKLVALKDDEITDLKQKFRDLTTLYYNYFFKQRDNQYIKLIKTITEPLHERNLLSDKAKVVYFEIKSIEHSIQSDLINLHETRKKQFKHLVGSSVFDSEILVKLMVFSNLFTKMKTEASITEINAHLEFMESYFLDTISKNPDSTLREKYYDIYFNNYCYALAWKPNKEKTNKLLELFDEVISNKLVTNKILLGRINLSLIQTLFIDENYKASTPLFTSFFNLLKKNKYSKLYIEGDLLFLFKNFLQEKPDLIENELEALNRKIKRYEIELNQDHTTLLELLNDLRKSKVKEPEYYIEKLLNNQIYRLFTYKLLTALSVEKILETHFSIKDGEYNEDLNSYFSR